MRRHQDERARARLLRTVAKLSDDPRFMCEVLVHISGRWRFPLERTDPDRLLTAAWTPFLLAPVPDARECPHAPRVRLVAFLSGNRRLEHVDHAGLADWLLNSALNTEDDDVHEALSGLFGTTDQPDLLDALRRAFDRAVRAARDPARWSGPALRDVGRSGRLVRILRANPHLLPGADEAGHAWAGPSGARLAVLQGRLDLIDAWSNDTETAETVVDVLLDGVELPAYAEFTNRCRQALRALRPGPARERLCVLAAAGHAFGQWPEATAAVVEAGHVWQEHPAALLFLTEQWERYDALDPDGSLLRAYCAAGAKGPLGHYRHQIEIIAERNGRPNPCPPPPPPAPSDRRRARRRTGSGALGSWPTDAGSGSSGFAGDHGGGFGGISC